MKEDKIDAGPMEEPLISFLRPSEIVSYQIPQGSVLVGDNHIVRGAVCVIGGAPGVGKSRAAVALAQAGATGEPWFGHEVHRRFKTMILQNENGRHRLKLEVSDISANLEEWVRISPPPPYGLCFNNAEFRDQLGFYIREFKPDVVIIDP
jgi:hypothetical protein